MVAPRSVREVMTKKPGSEEYAVRKPRCDNSPVQVFFSAHVCPTTFSFSQPPCIHSSGGCARQINGFFSGSITGASAKLLSSPCARIYFHTTKLPNGRYISTRSLFFTILLNEYVQFSCQCEVYVPVDGIFYNSVHQQNCGINSMCVDKTVN